MSKPDDFAVALLRGLGLDVETINSATLEMRAGQPAVLTIRRLVWQEDVPAQLTTEQYDVTPRK